MKPAVPSQPAKSGSGMDPARLRPKHRSLRVYAFDPILSTRMETFGINEVTLQVPWEVDSEGKDCLGPGPVGEYLEVVDYDPASGSYYAPVDLNSPYLLEQHGLPPSEGIPQFHQQMVYAVAMKTIRNFEKALGRCALWSRNEEKKKEEDQKKDKKKKGNKKKDEEDDGYVQRLRIYPHALREANAYYSPSKKALLFGYFPATAAAVGDNLPGGTVFTCLSHNIIAHETTHALLDGLHCRYVEPSNRDVLALHEAFADLVSLFQQFSIPDVLKDQIARHQGDLSRENLLAQLAHQFGQAIGNYRALRDALGEFDEETDTWKPKKPDPELIRTVLGPHSRGSILVAAIFRAFLSVYRARTEDLFRIATQGTGVLPEGALHPDLVNRLAEEAARVAGHFLRICIRALDYCPPADVTFGDYMRALITADLDLVPEDKWHYRIAIIEAFRRWGIYPLDINTLSVESLLWAKPTEAETAFFEALLGKKRDVSGKDVEARKEARPLALEWTITSNRERVFKECRSRARDLKKRIESDGFQEWLAKAKKNRTGKTLAKTLGLELGRDAVATIPRAGKRLPEFEVSSVRPALRKDTNDQVRTDLIIEITQRRRGYLNPAVQKEEDRRKRGKARDRDFWFRGGCTFVIDLAGWKCRYILSKRIGSDARLKRHRDHLKSIGGAYLRSALARPDKPETAEPFAIINRMYEMEGGSEWKAQ